ncbi:MAG: hypothetical protein HEP71_26135 [Roseivirga sp.]|nr:hypothetical protein [Roseivirga sp.]
MKVTEVNSFKLGEWWVEPKLLRISKKGEERKLEFKTMQILLLLASKPGEVVSKEQIHDEIWEGILVTDNALTRAISKLRKALGDNPRKTRYISTISKSGYRLVATVSYPATISSANEVKSLIDRRWIWALAPIALLAVLSNIPPRTTTRYSEFLTPSPVSTHIGPELAHSISPDGSMMSFSRIIEDRPFANVFVQHLDELREVNFTSNDTSHQAYGIWSPDGQYIAYVSTEEGDCGIYQQLSGGGDKKRIGSCLSNPDDLVWSPDGKTIAFTDQKDSETRRIYFLDLDSQKTKELMTPAPGTAHRDPAFGPEGKHLYFRKSVNGQGSDLYKLKLSNLESTRLTFENARIFGLDVFDNGSRLAFSSNRGGQWALWHISTDGGAIERFQINDRILLEPKIAANGQRMIYKSVTDQTRLWALNRSTNFEEASPMVPSTRADKHPALSADGKKLAFISDRSGFYELWVKDLITDKLMKLTDFEGSFISLPSWSIDGTSLIFDARTEGEHNIYTMEIATGEMGSFIGLEGDQLNARFSRDGKSVYFASNHQGSWQIYQQAVEGGELRQVTTTGGFYLQEGYDDQLYVVRSDTSGLWRMPMEGGESTLILPDFQSVDWGSWAPVADGILYVSRTTQPQLYHQAYNLEKPARLLFQTPKRVPLSTPALTATSSGDQIIFTQIEFSEDEIMMVDFK